MKQIIIGSFFIAVSVGCNLSTAEQDPDVRNEIADSIIEVTTSDTLNDSPTVRNVGEYTVSKDSLISSLAHMKSRNLDCSAKVYWKIIKRGKESIPLLIESLTDTTMTNIYDRCKKGKLNIGEVSYLALEEIAEFPAFVVTGDQFDVFSNDGCWCFFDYLYFNGNKPDYQQKVKAFYEKSNFQFREFEKSELTDCYRKYKITGKYKWINP